MWTMTTLVLLLTALQAGLTTCTVASDFDEPIALIPAEGADDVPKEVKNALEYLSNVIEPNGDTFSEEDEEMFEDFNEEVDDMTDPVEVETEMTEREEEGTPDSVEDVQLLPELEIPDPHSSEPEDDLDLEIHACNNRRCQWQRNWKHHRRNQKNKHTHVSMGQGGANRGAPQRHRYPGERHHRNKSTALPPRRMHRRPFRHGQRKRTGRYHHRQFPDKHNTNHSDDSHYHHPHGNDTWHHDNHTWHHDNHTWHHDNHTWHHDNHTWHNGNPSQHRHHLQLMNSNHTSSQNRYHHQQHHHKHHAHPHNIHVHPPIPHIHPHNHHVHQHQHQRKHHHQRNPIRWHHNKDRIMPRIHRRQRFLASKLNQTCEKIKTPMFRRMMGLLRRTWRTADKDVSARYHYINGFTGCCHRVGDEARLQCTEQQKLQRISRFCSNQGPLHIWAKTPRHRANFLQSKCCPLVAEERLQCFSNKRWHIQTAGSEGVTSDTEQTTVQPESWTESIYTQTTLMPGSTTKTVTISHLTGAEALQLKKVKRKCCRKGRATGRHSRNEGRCKTLSVPAFNKQKSAFASDCQTAFLQCCQQIQQKPYLRRKVTPKPRSSEEEEQDLRTDVGEEEEPVFELDKDKEEISLEEMEGDSIDSLEEEAKVIARDMIEEFEDDFPSS